MAFPFAPSLPSSLPYSPATFLLQVLGSSAVVGLSPADSLLRPASFPLAALCTYSIVANASQEMRPRWASLLGGTSFAFLLQHLDLALLRRWNYGDRGPARSPDASVKGNNSPTSIKRGGSCGVADTTSSAATADPPPQGDEKKNKSPAKQHGLLAARLWFGWSSTWSFRHVDSPHEVRNVPPFFPNNRKDRIPSRRRFVAQETLKALSCYLFLDLMGLRPAPRNNGELFDRALVPLFRRLGDVTPAELKLRALSFFGFALTFYCLIQTFTAAAAILAIGSSLSDVRSWRPAFGSPLDAYSLANVWGKFWHQLLRQLLVSPASKITHDVLHFPQRSALAQASTVFLAFAISGIMHSAAGVASSMSAAETGVFQFFCTQAVGVVVERMAQRLFNPSNKPPTPWQRLLGYIWVIAFMTWSSPVWLYPQAARPAPEGPSTFLPFSVVRALKPRTTS